MKAYAIAVTAIVLASTVSASSQSEGPYYSNTIHQSVGGRDSRGNPKYYQRPHTSQRRVLSTTGAGDDRNGPPLGPHYSNTIHQSAGGRDSRGNPKYYRPAPRSRAAETTGAGDNFGGEPPGPYYSNTIHQSVGGRDSRGSPKYYGR